jgi:hypothetical protein
MTPVDCWSAPKSAKELQTAAIAKGTFVLTWCTISGPPHGLQSPQEERMSKYAPRLLTLAICATALAAVPMVTPAKAEMSSSKHIKKHKKKIQKSHGFSEPRSAGQAWPVSSPSSQAGAACSRGFECAKWPSRR